MPYEFNIKDLPKWAETIKNDWDDSDRTRLVNYQIDTASKTIKLLYYSPPGAEYLNYSFYFNYNTAEFKKNFGNTQRVFFPHSHLYFLYVHSYRDMGKNIINIHPARIYVFHTIEKWDSGNFEDCKFISVPISNYYDIPHLCEGTANTQFDTNCNYLNAFYTTFFNGAIFTEFSSVSQHQWFIKNLTDDFYKNLPDPLAKMSTIKDFKALVNTKNPESTLQQMRNGYTLVSLFFMLQSHYYETNPDIYSDKNFVKFISSIKPYNFNKKSYTHKFKHLPSHNKKPSTVANAFVKDMYEAVKYSPPKKKAAKAVVAKIKQSVVY